VSQSGGPAGTLRNVLDAVTGTCQECAVELAGDSPDLRLELTYDDDEPVYYCKACSTSQPH
jgi:hypothetical protein